MEPQAGGQARELQVRPDEIPDSGLELELVQGPEILEAYIPREAGFELLEPVRSQFSLRRRGREVAVSGWVRTTLALPCDRCLADVVQPVDRRVETVFVPHPKVPEGGQIELTEKDLEVEFYGPEGVIDLGEVIAEELALALPSKTLCNAACKGLCPDCGANLNAEECHCPPKACDPRLAVLKDFKTD